MNRPAAGLSALLLCVGACGPVAHAPPVPPVPAVHGPPDPRRGERLDGRPSPEDPLRTARTAGDVALAIPRWLIEALFWPVVQVASYAERHHLVARAYWALTSEDELVGLRPEARYETPFATVGARFFDRRTLGRGSLVELMARTAGPRYLFGELRLQAPHESSLTVELHALFERNPDQPFSGTHGESMSELLDAGRGLAQYGFEHALSSLTLQGQIAGALRVALSGETDLRAYHSSDSLDALYCAAPGTTACTGVDDALVPGFHEGLRVVRARAGLLLDTRQRPRLGGVRLAVDAELVHGFLGDPSAHARIVADARLVLDLSDHILILRLDAGAVMPLGDAPVPFDELLSPSGNDGLRGLASGRLRGQSQLFGSVEYRWLLAPYLDAAVFVDHGGAFDRNFARLSFDRMIPSYGFALRIHDIRGDYWNAGPLLLLQFAHASDEGSRLVISLGGGD
jgi:hypothetical protein